MKRISLCHLPTPIWRNRALDELIGCELWVKRDDMTSGAAAGASSTDIATGSASSVGSADRTAVSQQVVTSVTDQAIAQVTQVVFVLNVGAALAESGSNTAQVGTSGSGGGASTQTGNALAIGNDASTAITQAAAGSAPAGTSDSTRTA